MELRFIYICRMQNGLHNKYMHRCLQLAALGAGQVAPNPMVGAVLVHEGMIIGEGYHQQYGGPHAEVNCINNAMDKYGNKISSATLYVSLEPCAHYGKTPPCADLIIKHKIPQVVIGCRDAFEKVNGKGVEKLLTAGVSVTTGIMDREAIGLNKAFFTFHEHKRPYIILKWAQTADGFMASNDEDRVLISNDYANRLVHQWRSETAAIMVGANTALADNPLLDNRLWFGKKPKKIVWDPGLKVPENLRLFSQGDEVIVFNAINEAKKDNITYLKIDKNNMLREVLQHLCRLQVQSLFVEGGQRLLQLFIEAGLWDEARIIVNKDLFIEQGMTAPQLINSQKLTTTSLANDEIIYFKNKSNHFINAVA